MGENHPIFANAYELGIKTDDELIEHVGRMDRIDETTMQAHMQVFKDSLQNTGALPVFPFWVYENRRRLEREQKRVQAAAALQKKGAEEHPPAGKDKKSQKRGLRRLKTIRH